MSNEAETTILHILTGMEEDVRDLRSEAAEIRKDIAALYAAQNRTDGAVRLAKWLVGLCVTFGIGLAGLFGVGHRP